MANKAKLKRILIGALKHNLAGGKRPPPELGRILWSAFAALSRQRSHDMTGPNPISFPEIEAYCRLMCLPLEPAHISVLIAMDQIWMDHAREVLARPNDKGAMSQVSQQPMAAPDPGSAVAHARAVGTGGLAGQKSCRGALLFSPPLDSIWCGVREAFADLPERVLASIRIEGDAI